MGKTSECGFGWRPVCSRSSRFGTPGGPRAGYRLQPRPVADRAGHLRLSRPAGVGPPGGRRLCGRRGPPAGPAGRHAHRPAGLAAVAGRGTCNVPPATAGALPVRTADGSVWLPWPHRRQQSASPTRPANAPPPSGGNPPTHVTPLPAIAQTPQAFRSQAIPAATNDQPQPLPPRWTPRCLPAADGVRTRCCTSPPPGGSRWRRTALPAQPCNWSTC